MPSVNLVWQLIRPFTLLAPSVGFLAGAIVGARGWPSSPAFFGVMAAAFLNAASNVANQIFDLEIDRVNKPERILPSGKLSVTEAWGVTFFFFLLSLVTAWQVPNKQFFAIVCLAAFITFFYSSPPLRMKRFPYLSNVWIAIPRGLLLPVSGWASVRTIWNQEIWTIGVIFGLFVFGATTTKDFSDVEGDRRFGCTTLPDLLGFRGAARFMAPFLTLSFLLFPLAHAFGFLTGRPKMLFGLGVLLFLWGGHVMRLILKKPEALAVDKNHPSWKQMYLMLMAAQIGLMFAYWGM